MPKSATVRGFPRLSAGSGEDDRRQAGRDPGEAMLAPGELTDQLVQAVCRRPEEHAARLRGGNTAHRSMKHICIVERANWHSGILPKIEAIQSGIPTFRAQGASDRRVWASVN
jgi:hypothetical protein